MGVMRPNFFIVGAPKCGTTSMYEYLKAHPQVFMPCEKEPHYFATDLPVFRRMVDESAYLALFSAATVAERAIGEASVWYLFSDNALREIKNFCPKARILVFFRNPVDFVQSLHAQFAFNGGRNPDFIAAWTRPSSRGRLIRAGAFGTQFRRLTSIFAPEQYLVILQDDLRNSPRDEYLRVLEFLGLDDDGRMDFSVSNANKEHWSPRLARFARHTPLPLDRAWRRAKESMGLRGLGLMDMIRKLNVRQTSRGTIPDSVRAEINSAFKDEVCLLSEQLGRDLAHWR